MSTIGHWIAEYLPDYAETERELRLVVEKKRLHAKKDKDHSKRKRLAKKILSALSDGGTLAKTGKSFGLTLGETRELLKLFPEEYKIALKSKAKVQKALQKKKEALEAEKKAAARSAIEKERQRRRKEKEEKRAERMLERWGRTGKTFKDDHERRRARLFFNARGNAGRVGREFTISIHDIHLPKKCPVLGIPLDYTFGKPRTDGTPSLDRIDSDKGYIPGNVVVISWRANFLKSNGTPEEHRKIWEFFRNKSVARKQR